MTPCIMAVSPRPSERALDASNPRTLGARVGPILGGSGWAHKQVVLRLLNQYGDIGANKRERERERERGGGGGSTMAVSSPSSSMRLWKSGALKK